MTQIHELIQAIEVLLHQLKQEVGEKHTIKDQTQNTTLLERQLEASIKVERQKKRVNRAREKAELTYAPPLEHQELELWSARLEFDVVYRAKLMAEAHHRPEAEFRRVFYWLYRDGVVEYDRRVNGYIKKRQ